MPRRRAAAARLFAAAALAAAAVLVPAARPAAAQQEDSRALQQARQQRDQQFDSMKRMVSSFRPFPAKHVEDVLRLKLDRDGHLVSEVPDEFKNAAAGTQRKVDVPELPGPTYVQLVPTFNRGLFIPAAGPAGAKAQLPPRVNALILQSTLRPDPDTLVSMHVQSQPGMFQISQTTQRGIGRYDSLSLVEMVNPQNGMPVGVSLNVNAFGTDATGYTQISLAADDFASLRREYPQQVDQHLRPLLARLGQEHLFAPDPRVAWQVLESYFPSDPAVEAKVRAILPRLSDPEFAKREAALKDLVDLGRPGVAALTRMDHGGLSPDQAVLVGRAVAGYRKLPEAMVARLARDRSFLLDCLLLDEAELPAAAAEQLKKVTGRPALAYDPNGTVADRSAAVRELRAEILGPKPASRPATRPATKPTTQPTTAPAR